MAMTEQEKINVSLQRQIDAQNARIDNIAAKVDMIINELQQQREDNRQAQAKHDAEIKGALKHIQGLTIAAMVGIVAIAGATWAFMWSSTRNDIPPQNPPAQTAQAAPINENAPK